MPPESVACARRQPILRRLSAILVTLLSTPLLAEPAGSSDATAEEGGAYIDQLIDPQAADSTWLAGDEVEEQPEGMRSFSTEYRHFQQDLDQAGKSDEDGIILHGAAAKPVTTASSRCWQRHVMNSHSAASMSLTKSVAGSPCASTALPRTITVRNAQEYVQLRIGLPWWL